MVDGFDSNCVIVCIECEVIACNRSAMMKRKKKENGLLYVQILFFLETTCRNLWKLIELISPLPTYDDATARQKDTPLHGTHRIGVLLGLDSRGRGYLLVHGPIKSAKLQNSIFESVLISVCRGVVVEDLEFKGTK